MITLAHYHKALEIFNSPEFEEQEVILHDFGEFGYGPNKINHGWTDGLVCAVTAGALPNAQYYGYSAYLNDEANKSRLSNSRNKSVKFGVVKAGILANMVDKITAAEKEEAAYQRKVKPFEEITIPLELEGKQFFLVKYRDNYADEFDVHGFAVFSQEELDAWKNSIPEEYTFSIGTNEEIEYDSKESFLYNFTIIPLVKTDVDTLYAQFGYKTMKHLDWNGRSFNKKINYHKCQFGHFPMPKEDDD